MIVQFDGKEYQFDLEDIDVSQARYIKRQTGMTLLKLQEGLEEVDADCLVALYWLMKAQNGEVVDMGKVNFKIVKFGNAIIEALAKEREAQEANPTQAPEEAAPVTTQL